MSAVPGTPAVGRAAFAAARARAVRGLRGRVLEIGAGRGANFADLDPGVEWLGLESAAGPRRRLAVNARHHGHQAAPIAASAEAVPLPAASVDGVLGTTVLCSVRDPAAVLDEVARVLVPGGRLVLAEHVAAPPGSRVRALQQAVRPWTRLLDHGCDPTRDTVASVARSSLLLETVTPFLVPVLGRLSVPFVVIEARAPR